MDKKILLQKLEHSPAVKTAGAPFFLETIHSEKINREGIYFSLINKLFDSDKKIPNALLSQFSPFNKVSEFYTIKSRKKYNPNDLTSILILFHLNPHSCSLEILSDSLDWIKKILLTAPHLKIRGYFHYDLDITNPLSQQYLTNYFRLVEEKLSSLPENVSLLDIQKQSSFDDVLIAEAGTQWACLDNYLVHVVLSKGGQYYQAEFTENFNLVSETELSPYHCLQQLNRPQRNVVDNEEIFKELEKLNLIKNPEDLKMFFYLSYKNIFKGLS